MEIQKDANIYDLNESAKKEEISLEDHENSSPENDNHLSNSMDDDLAFNIVITSVEHKIVDQNMNISNIKNYNNDNNNPFHRSKSSSSTNDGATKRTIDSDNSTEDNENSIKGKSIDEIYETCLMKKKQQKNEKYFKHSDADKLKEILINKGKFNKDNNIINKLFGTEK